MRVKMINLLCKFPNYCHSPLTSSYCPLVLCHCWLGHLTRKIVPNMTYNVFGGTLNFTQLNLSYQLPH